MGRVSSTAASTLGSGVSNPLVQSIDVTAATEETIVLPTSTRRFEIKLRDCQGFKVRYIASSVEFYTVECGNSYEESGLSPTSTYTIYIEPDTTGVLEIISWS